MKTKNGIEIKPGLRVKVIPEGITSNVCDPMSDNNKEIILVNLGRKGKLICRKEHLLACDEFDKVIPG